MSVILPPSSDAVPSELARRHQAALAAAAETRTDSALCAAISSAEQAQQQLGTGYQQRWENMMAGPSADAGGPDQLVRDAAHAQRQLPGVGLALGAETVYHWVRHGALAPYAPEGSASARALLLAGELRSEPAGQAIYFEPTTDISGCMRPAAALPKLRALAAVWPAAAACVKQQLRPKLLASIEEMANAGCYCTSKSETSTALKQIAVLGKVFASASASRTAPISTVDGARRYSCR